MTTKICFTHSMPAIVIAHTVEMKSISPDTWTRGPVLSYFPDLVTTFTNDRATLTRRDHQPQGNLRSIGSCAIGHRAANVLFRFVNNHSKGFKDGISGSNQNGNSLRTISFRDVDTWPLYSCILTDSFFLMILLTSFPCISSQMVRVIFNPSIMPVSTSSSVLDSWTLVKSLVAGGAKAKNCRSEATEGKRRAGGKGKSRWPGAE